MISRWFFPIPWAQPGNGEDSTNTGEDSFYTSLNLSKWHHFLKNITRVEITTIISITFLIKNKKQDAGKRFRGMLWVLSIALEWIVKLGRRATISELDYSEESLLSVEENLAEFVLE